MHLRKRAIGMSSGGQATREIGKGGSLISIFFNSARVLLLSNMGGELVLRFGFF